MTDQTLIKNLEEEVAIEAASLYFQNEMLMEEQELDMIKLYQQIGNLIDEGIDWLSWGYIYPLIKDCVKQ